MHCSQWIYICESIRYRCFLLIIDRFKASLSASFCDDRFWHLHVQPVIIAPSCCFSVGCDLSLGTVPPPLLGPRVQLADSDTVVLMTHCFAEVVLRVQFHMLSIIIPTPGLCRVRDWHQYCPTLAEITTSTIHAELNQPSLTLLKVYGSI